ncbi:MAG: TolC family protein [Proteobacteria bacterium]|nr:MAG: TolC family protein [Pseudomonadota bacterium]
MVKIWASSLILSLSIVGGAASAQVRDLTCKPSVSLSQKDVAEIVLQQGRRTKETNLGYQQFRLALAQSLQPYEWNFLATSGYQFDKSVGFTTTAFDKTENWITNLILSKNFSTGTLASVEYKRTSLKGAPNITGVAAGVRSVQTQDLLGINLEQDLWANFFGNAARGDMDAADLSYKARSVLRTNDLENVVLDTIRQFWTTFVSERNFKEATTSRDRSKKLVDAVRKKSGFGYANPGEYSQAQADYEARVQDVKNASTTYLANLDTLNSILGLPSGCEVKFVISDVVPSVPQLPEKSVNDLRVIRSQKLALNADERAFDAAKSKDAPTLRLVGKLYSYGVDPDGDAAYSSMMAGTQPQYYAGVKFQYAFGSEFLGENRLNKRYARELEEVRLARATQESQDGLAQAQRKVQTSYSAVLSATEQRKFRERALQELNRSFGQGRTDISIYIDAMNKFSASEIQYSQAIGNYQTALNEWAAVRDELIPDSQEEQ